MSKAMPNGYGSWLLKKGMASVEVTRALGMEQSLINEFDLLCKYLTTHQGVSETQAVAHLADKNGSFRATISRTTPFGKSTSSLYSEFLHYLALNCRDKDILDSILIDYTSEGQNLNAKDKDGYTAIVIGVGVNNENFCEILLKYQVVSTETITPFGSKLLAELVRRIEADDISMNVLKAWIKGGHKIDLEVASNLSYNTERSGEIFSLLTEGKLEPYEKKGRSDDTKDTLVYSSRSVDFVPVTTSLDFSPITASAGAGTSAALDSHLAADPVATAPSSVASRGVTMVAGAGTSAALDSHLAADPVATAPSSVASRVVTMVAGAGTSAALDSHLAADPVATAPSSVASRGVTMVAGAGTSAALDSHLAADPVATAPSSVASRGVTMVAGAGTSAALDSHLAADPVATAPSSVASRGVTMVAGAGTSAALGSHLAADPVATAPSSVTSGGVTMVAGAGTSVMTSLNHVLNLVTFKKLPLKKQIDARDKLDSMIKKLYQYMESMDESIAITMSNSDNMVSVLGESSDAKLPISDDEALSG